MKSENCCLQQVEMKILIYWLRLITRIIDYVTHMQEPVLNLSRCYNQKTNYAERKVWEFLKIKRLRSAASESLEI
jgi:hypothetical protein